MVLVFVVCRVRRELWRDLAQTVALAGDRLGPVAIYFARVFNFLQTSTLSMLQGQGVARGFTLLTVAVAVRVGSSPTIATAKISLLFVLRFLQLGILIFVAVILLGVDGYGSDTRPKRHLVVIIGFGRCRASKLGNRRLST